MPPVDVRLDLVHTSPVVAGALRRELAARAPHLRVETVVHSWSAFRSDWDFAGDVVVLDPLLDDHVPLPLKVRALHRLGSRVIVLGPGRDTPFARRCGDEGAIAWIEPVHGLTAAARMILLAALGTTPHEAAIGPARPPVAALTDRQLQVLAMYAMTRGLSPAFLARVLTLRTETVRSHLERGRARYRAAGRSTGSRGALRAVLIEDGWILDPSVWVEAGRP